MKLRRQESFMLNLTRGLPGESYRSYWMHPSIPVQFHRSGHSIGSLNQRWVERLLEEANRPDGLWLMREPDESVIP